MKKYSVILAATVMAASLMACGTGAAGVGESTAEVSVEALSTEETASEQAKDTALGVPVVKDGVMQAGEDCVETYFEWNSIDGADGYEVSVLNKYYGEAEFTEPAEVYETTDCNYTLGAQDYWDFLIKVRAYKGTGADRVYGEWSEEAAGFTYDDSEIADDTVTEANDVSGADSELADGTYNADLVAAPSQYVKSYVKSIEFTEDAIILEASIYQFDSDWNAIDLGMGKYTLKTNANTKYVSGGGEEDPTVWTREEFATYISGQSNSGLGLSFKISGGYLTEIGIWS